MRQVKQGLVNMLKLFKHVEICLMAMLPDGIVVIRIEIAPWEALGAGRFESFLLSVGVPHLL